MKKIYIVTCSVSGCEECGDEYHIVGVFSTKIKAKEAELKHEKYKHLHGSYVHVEELELDVYMKSYLEE